jgi:hypothetical protein
MAHGAPTWHGFTLELTPRGDDSVEGGSPVAAMVFQQKDNNAVAKRWLQLILHGGGSVRTMLR